MFPDKINRVILDFSFSKEEESEALQKSRSLFYDKAMKQLNALFETVEEHIYIDSLEIDISKTSAENFEADFSTELVKSFKKYIAASEKTFIENSKPTAASDIDNLLYFLINGYWNWNYQQKTNEEILNLVTAIFKDEMQAVQLFTKLQLKNYITAERLINLAGENKALWNLLIRSLQKYHPALSSLAKLFPSNWADKAAKPGKFFFYLMSKLMVTAPINNTQQFLVVLKKITHPEFFPNYNPDERSGDEKTGLKKPAASLKRSQPVKGDELLRSFFAEADNLPASKTISAALLNTDSAVVAEISDDLISGNDLQKVTIQNAGLVLFYPFLSYAFAEMKWLSADKKFIDNRVQQKAILFLQYLINGKSRQAEHELVLNKILCGWPVHLPLKVSCNFSAAEKAVANDLIESLKEHWAVVKTTSAAGIISSFVNRAGLIQKTETGYTLQVEKRTIDILMNSLPFSISIIKLPWNEHMLNTEW